VPTKLRDVEKLKPVDEIAIHFFLRAGKVKEILQRAAVQSLGLVVSPKQTSPANESDGYAAIAQRLLITANCRAARSLTARFAEQAAELETLKRQVAELLAARGAA
jgi:hypothetical protein